MKMLSLRFALRFSCLVVGLAVAGCSSYSGSGVTPLATEPDIVGTRIAEATEKASTALETISGIEQMRTPLPQPDDYSSAPPGLMQMVTVKWTGPIEQLVQTLASRSGMGFKVKGHRPTVPIVITVDAYQQPMIEMLRDLGLQAGKRADLTINAQGSFIEISYAPVDRI